MRKLSTRAAAPDRRLSRFQQYVPLSGVMPTVQNTGIPLGLSVPTTQYGYFGEGLTDSRPIETLVAATTTTVPGMSVPDANNTVYLPNTATNQVYDHIDFTNFEVVVGANALSVTFTKCKFGTTNDAWSLTRAQGAHLFQNLGANTAVTFQDCSLDGSTPNVNYACQNMVSNPSGNTSAGGVTFLRNNIRGFSTLTSVGPYTNFLIADNYCHDPVIDKHNDVTPYTNSGVWAHVDGFQIGAVNALGTGIVRNNTLLAYSAAVRTATGPLQVGQMAGPAPATITSFVFTGNWCDGGGYICGANLGTAIVIANGGKFEFTNNKIGLGYQYGIDSGGTIHSIATLWSGNTYVKTGMAGLNTPVAVTAGQVIP